jgi:hypothetical protein
VAEPLAAALAGLRADLLDAGRLVRAVGSGRRRAAVMPASRRVELRWVDLRAGRRLSVVRLDQRQSRTTTVEPGAEAALVDQLLAEPYGTWHLDLVDATVQLRVTKRGDAQVHRGPRATAVPDRRHDRPRPTLLDPRDPVLHALGLTTADGSVKAGRHAKLRQVEQLLRALEPVLPALTAAAGAGPLHVVDLGCGNAYLTHAAHGWLAARLGREVRLTGVDEKVQARDHGTAVAAALGRSEAVRFVAAPIARAVVPEPVHLVLALHACDTATDDALARAVRWQAPVMLAAPCCHHDVQHQLAARARAGAVPPAGWAGVTRHGILRERLADVLTDALRAAVLRQHGYRVEVIEFVESVHTPRNVLLRAVRTGAPASAAAAAEYTALTKAWGITPALARRLADAGSDSATT